MERKELAFPNLIIAHELMILLQEPVDGLERPAAKSRQHGVSIDVGVFADQVLPGRDELAVKPQLLEHVLFVVIGIEHDHAAARGTSARAAATVRGSVELPSISRMRGWRSDLDLGVGALSMPMTSADGPAPIRSSKQAKYNTDPPCITPVCRINAGLCRATSSW